MNCKKYDKTEKNRFSRVTKRGFLERLKYNGTLYSRTVNYNLESGIIISKKNNLIPGLESVGIKNIIVATSSSILFFLRF